MITCKINKRYGDRVALNVDCAFKEGKIYAVIGHNGSGKSTLLNALAGQIPYEGAVEIPQKTAYMPQITYNFDLSVRRNILLFASKKDVAKQQKATELMEEIGLSALAKKNAKRLSGGEGQKTALLRTLMQDAEVYLLDEPTSSMDTASTQVAQNLIRALRSRGATVILVTHSISEAEHLADDILYLEDGNLVERGQHITEAPATDSLRAYLSSR